jgi:uncharacterized membrane protein
MGTEKSIEVAVPVRTAYNQWTQFEDFPRFMSGVDRVTQVTPTRNHWVTSIGGVEREFDTEITEQLPDERIAWTSVEGEVEQSGVVTFHRLDETHTKIMVQLEMDPVGVADKAADKLGVVDRQVKADLGKFKDFVEARGTETGGWRGEVPRSEP